MTKTARRLMQEDVNNGTAMMDGENKSTASAEMVGASGMEELIRCHDWNATSLGQIDAWPQSLRTTVQMMLAAGHAMCLMWGADRILLYNDLYAPFLGLRHPAALGKPTAEVWSDVWSDIQPLVEQTFAGKTSSFREHRLLMTRNGYEEETWWDFSYSPVRDEGGEVAGLLNVTFECSARVIAQRELDDALGKLRESEAFVRSVLAASTDCIKVLELDGTLSFMSEGGMAVMEISDFNDVKGCPWPDFLQNEGSAFAREALEAAKRGVPSQFTSAANTYLGTPKHWSVSVSPILGADNEPERVLSVSRDITELEEARTQQRLLNAELAHRIKNTMSVVQAIAYQTLGRIVDPKEYEGFESRMTALAASHNLLTGEHWSTALIDNVVRTTLSTFGADRFQLSGPTIQVGSRATLALSLMLYELATNAFKYGSLSVPEGKVILNWDVQPGDAGQVLNLQWRETGGPPATEPTRKGFGSRIIRMGLIGSGGVNLFYGTEGFRLQASAPLRQVQES